MGHRIREQDVVEWTEQGQAPADIVREFPQLTLADIHAALAYYFDHQALIEQQRAAGEGLAEELQALEGCGPLGEVK